MHDKKRSFLRRFRHRYLNLIKQQFAVGSTSRPSKLVVPGYRGFFSAEKGDARALSSFGAFRHHCPKILTTQKMFNIEVLFLLLLSIAIGVNGEGRIFYGRQAKPGQFPYFASIKRYGKHYCGGALVSPNMVITAAHCVSGKDIMGEPLKYPLEDYSVRIGCYRQDEPLSDACVHRRIRNAIIHPMWDGDVSSFGADLALLELSDSVESITPIEVAEKAEVGEQGIIPGFGETEVGGMDGDSPNTLLYVKQTIDFIDGSLLTTLSDVKGACNGDSGGPLVTTSDDKNATSCEQVAAIVVFGTNACDSFEDLDGFLYLPKYAAWIDAQLQGGVGSGPPQSPSEGTHSITKGTYRLKVVSEMCEYMFLAPSLQNDCLDASVNLYYRSKVARTRTAYWKIITKSDGTVYLQSVAMAACVDSFLSQGRNGNTELGPINESWTIQKSKGANVYAFRSSSTGQYLSADEKCRPSDVPSSQSKKTLLFELEKVTIA